MCGAILREQDYGDVAVPKVIRKEFLETIDRGWKGSEETWIDVIAVPTDYRWI